MEQCLGIRCQEGLQQAPPQFGVLAGRHHVRVELVDPGVHQAHVQALPAQVGGRGQEQGWLH